MSQSPGSKAGRQSFQGGLALPIIATVRQARYHRIVDVAHCRKTSLTVTTVSQVQTSDSLVCCSHAGWVFEYQAQNAVSDRKGGYLSGNRKHTHPILNEWFSQMPALFSLLRYISNVSIDILKGNSLKIGV
jgi:hypothetical protein